jgi:hypothetical protein
MCTGYASIPNTAALRRLASMCTLVQDAVRADTPDKLPGKRPISTGSANRARSNCGAGGGAGTRISPDYRIRG